MTITLEAIRAAGGIVHSDGNIFFRDISMLQGLAGAAPAAVAPLPAVFEQIAQSWDGCMYDAPGETLDIGADIRAAAKRLLAEHPAAVAPQGDEDDSLLLCASDLQHSAIYDSHSEMQDCARSVADRIKALAARALAAPALEAPAAPVVPLKATPEMRAAFRLAYRRGAYRERGLWGNRMDYALDQMLAAAPQAPAVDLRPHLAWALKRISTSLGEGEHFAAAQQALDAAQQNTLE